MIRLNTTLTALALILCVGCADAPSRLDELSQTNPGLVSELGSLSHAEWTSGAPGCEGADLADLALFVCEDEPTLGALVADDGAVVCVDSLDLLVAELLEEIEAGLVAADPSPQPSHPGRPDTGSADGASMPTDGIRVPVYAQSTGGAHADPTPTPIIEADPTPTPMTSGTFDSLPTALIDRDPDEEDPTPTPTTES